jgi:hypothetical protein
VTADFGNGRNFNLTGAGGINIESDGIDTLYVNATTLQAQYNSQQMSITTLFDMMVAAQMAIDILDEEVVKSVNYVTPNPGTHNLNFTGTCLTSVYGQALGEVAVDFCELIAFAQDTFANVSYDFTAIDARLDQELADMQILLTKTNATVDQAEVMLDDTVFLINTVSPMANNINITGGTGMSVSEGPGSQVVLRNEGLVVINGLASQSNIVIGGGTGLIVSEQTHSVTLTNPFFISPCTWRAQGVAFLWNVGAVGTYQPLIMAWAPYTMTPANCYVGTPILQGIPGPGPATYGQLNMPPGIWTLDATIIFFLTNGLGVQLNLQFRNYFYQIQFPSVNFFQPNTAPGTSGFFQHHFSITFSDKEIPPGEQFSVHYTSTVTPTAQVVYWYYTDIVTKPY